MNSNTASDDRNRLWRRIGDDFRQACLLRREGKAKDAAAILEKRLPETIGAWARVCGLRQADRRERLNQLFEQEQKRVDDIWLSQQIILRQMRDILIPSLCLQVAEEVREVMELQMEQVNTAIANLSPAPERRSVSPVTAQNVAPGAVVNLPKVMPTERSAVPNFDDVPAIIYEFINSDLRGTALNARANALA